MAHLFPNLKLKLKPFPHSFSLPLQNHLQPCSSGTAMKLYSLGSSNSLLRHIFIGSMFVSSVICTGQLLSRCMHCSQKKNHFIKLWSNATRFLASRFCREEATHVDPDPELAGEVEVGDLPLEEDSRKGSPPKLAGEAAHVDLPQEVSLKDPPLELAGEVAHVDLPVEVSRNDPSLELVGEAAHVALPQDVSRNDPSLDVAGEVAHVDLPLEVSRKDAPLELAGEVAHVDLPLEVSRKDTLPELAGDQIDLPPELWGEIGERLTSRLDILWFRSVCRKWRACLSYPSRFPLRVPPPPNCHPKLLNVPFFITEVTLYSSLDKSLYFEVEEVEQGGKFLFRRMLNHERNKLSSDGLILPRTLPLSKLCFVSKGFCYRMDRMAPPHEKRGKGRRYWDWRGKTFVQKVVLISSNVDGVNPSYIRGSDLSVIAHLNRGTMRGRLALLRLGTAPQNWKWDTDFCPHVFENIATYQGRLCALDRSGRVFVMDYNSLTMTQIAAPPPFLTMKPKHLIEHCGDLYLVDLSMMFLDVFEVYVLCFRLQEWHLAGNKYDVLSTLYPFYVGA